MHVVKRPIATVESKVCSSFLVGVVVVAMAKRRGEDFATSSETSAWSALLVCVKDSDARKRRGERHLHRSRVQNVTSRRRSALVRADTVQGAANHYRTGSHYPLLTAERTKPGRVCTSFCVSGVILNMLADTGGAAISRHQGCSGIGGHVGCWSRSRPP